MITRSRSRNKVGFESTCLSPCSSEDEPEPDSFDINKRSMTASMFQKQSRRIWELKKDQFQIYQNQGSCSSTQQESSMASSTNTAVTVSTTGINTTSFENKSFLTSSVFQKVSKARGQEFQKLRRIRSLSPQGKDSTATTTTSSVKQNSTTFDINSKTFPTSSVFKKVSKEKGREFQKLGRFRSLSASVSSRDSTISTSAITTLSTTGNSTTFDINDNRITSGVLARFRERRGQALRSSLNRHRSLSPRCVDSSSTVAGTSSSQLSTTFDIHDNRRNSRVLPGFNESRRRVLDRPPISNRSRAERDSKAKLSQQSLTRVATDKSSGIPNTNNSGDIEDMLSDAKASTNKFPGSEAKSEDQAEIYSSIKSLSTIHLDSESIENPACSNASKCAEEITKDTFYNYESGSCSSALKSCGVKLPPNPRRNKGNTGSSQESSSKSSIHTPMTTRSTNISEMPSGIISSTSRKPSCFATPKVCSRALPIDISPSNYADPLILSKNIIVVSEAKESEKTTTEIQERNLDSEIAGDLKKLSIIHRNDDLNKTVDLPFYPKEPEVIDAASLPPLVIINDEELLRGSEVKKSLVVEIDITHGIISEIVLGSNLTSIDDESTHEPKNSKSLHQSTPSTKPRKSACKSQLRKKRKTRSALKEKYTRNDNLIYTQLVSDALKDFEIVLKREDVDLLVQYLNTRLEQMLNKLCEMNKGFNGIFTYRQLEKALQQMGLIDPEWGQYGLRLMFATILSPTKYNQIKGVLIPFAGEDDTNLDDIPAALSA